MAKDTKKIIVKAFLRLAQKNPNIFNFTLSEIADEAGISRQTIYRHHFKDVAELLDYIHNQIDEEIFDTLYAFNDTPDKLIDYCADRVPPLIYKHISKLKILYTSVGDPKWNQFLLTRMNQFIASKIKLPNAEHNQFKLQLFTSSILSIIHTWVIQDQPMPPEKFGIEFKDFIVALQLNYFKMEYNN